ncbi:hypothetical protein AVEN_255043-1 [Araneus ventricosus]|uniref:Uncharacterized protein n=1 Tax=Araneus ventricosus TaxID=182803 RepID=A0A4Y2V022_ARAVE|nr:hypothetical protein AVEN_255043-1 [Araneus ventricosus]
MALPSRVTSENQAAENRREDDEANVSRPPSYFLKEFPKEECALELKEEYVLVGWENQFNLSKCIYSEINLNCSNKKNLEFEMFAARCYRNRFQAASACFAPRNNLQLLKSLKEREGVSYVISKCAVNKDFPGHLWCLTEMPVALVLLDDYISQETKRADALETEENDEH